MPDVALKEQFENAFAFARDNFGIRPLEREVSKYRQWQQILSNKASQYQAGFAQLDAKALLQKLMDVPQKGLEAVQQTCLAIIKMN